MRNDKKNPFFTDVGLFSASLFGNRIQTRKDFADHTDDKVKALWTQLKKIWEDGESTLTSSRINESDTEKEFIDPIFRSLGFSYITKTNLSGVSRDDLRYPDYTLFCSKTHADESRAAEQEYKFKSAVCLAEGKKFGFTLNEIDSEGRAKAEVGLPAIQLTEYLKMAEVDWGILTNGKQWQIYYRRGQYAAARYFEINLVDLLSHPQPRKEFAVFLYLFSSEAFKRDKNGKCRLDELYDEGKKYAQEVGEPFYEGCRVALRAVFEFYQKSTKAQKDIHRARLAHQASLILLFRVIAIRYLEDRGVLPTQSGQYRDVSLDVVRLKIEQTLKSGKKFSKSSKEIWQRLRFLFRDVNSGVYGIYVGHKGFESELFEIDFDKYFTDNPMDDDLLAQVIDSICRGVGKNAAQIDFYDMGVEKVGDVYNELLGLRIVQNEKKEISLAASSAKKKELGSYFTHPKLTQLVSDGVLQYLRDRYKNRGDWLSISFCDNSCGSGHFLRQLIEDLSYELFTLEAATGGVKSQNFYRRRLAQHCAFGIDRDINAVWLTKLSLWLQTAENGKPFVFLDHHIVNGDSILSTMDRPDFKAADLQKLRKHCNNISSLKSETKEEVVQARKEWAEIQSVLRPYSRYIRPQTELFDIDPELKKTYFCYPQTFPEIFLKEDGSQGFAIIVGNPPWETIKPKLPDFYRMKTGEETPPNRTKLDTWIDGDSKLSNEYEHWESGIRAYADSVREAGFKNQSGEVYTYAYFVERSVQCLQKDGLLAYIVKLGLFGDKGTSKLRNFLFRENTTDKAWVFKSNKVPDATFFPRVDPNEKFVIFNTRKTKTTTYQFMAKNIGAVKDLSYDFESWQKYSIPSGLDELSNVNIYDSQARRSISEKIMNFPTVKSVGLSVGSEIHLTNERKFFSTSKTSVPIYKGDEVRHFQLSAPANWCRSEKKLSEYASASIARIGVNDILPNSRRKVRAAIIPEGVLTANSILVVTGFADDDQMKLALASLNSMITEFVLRPRLSNIHLNNFRLEALPIPANADPRVIDAIVSNVEKLMRRSDFREDSVEYKKVEALLSIAYGLTREELRSCLSSFSDTAEEFINDVIGYAESLRDELGLARILSFKPKTAFEKTVAQRLGVASLIVARLNEDSSLGRTKFEKVFYLVDAHERLSLKTEYYREAYGPLDQRTLYNEKWGILPLAQRYGYFSNQARAFGKGKTINQIDSGKNLKEGLSFVKDVLGDRAKVVTKFIEQFKKLDTDQIELVATVYAAWNDLLLAKKEPSEKAVAREVLERWHPSKKKKFDATKVANCMRWIKKQGFVPHGKGKRTQTKPTDDDIGF